MEHWALAIDVPASSGRCSGQGLQAGMGAVLTLAVPGSFIQGCYLRTWMCFALVLGNLPDRDSSTDMAFQSRLLEVKFLKIFNFSFCPEDDVSHD